MGKTLEGLRKKRERLDAEIAAAEATEKRKIEVMNWPEFLQILSLPDKVLREEFARLASRKS